MSDLKVEDFFRKWVGTRPNLKTAFHEAGIEAMAFAVAYHKALQKANEAETGESNCTIFGVIHWAFLPEQTPSYGDEILLVYPPEQMTKPIVTIYDRNTEWIDGCKYAVITPCV